MNTIIRGIADAELERATIVNARKKQFQIFDCTPRTTTATIVDSIAVYVPYNKAIERERKAPFDVHTLFFHRSLLYHNTARNNR